MHPQRVGPLRRFGLKWDIDFNLTSENVWILETRSENGYEF